MALYLIASWIMKPAIEAGLPERNAIIASAIYNFGAFAVSLAGSIAATKVNAPRLCSLLPLAAVAVVLMGITLQGGFNVVYPIAASLTPMRCAPPVAAGHSG